MKWIELNKCIQQNKVFVYLATSSLNVLLFGQLPKTAFVYSFFLLYMYIKKKISLFFLTFICFVWIVWNYSRICYVHVMDCWFYKFWERAFRISGLNECEKEVKRHVWKEKKKCVARRRYGITNLSCNDIIRGSGYAMHCA